MPAIDMNMVAFGAGGEGEDEQLAFCKWVWPVD